MGHFENNTRWWLGQVDDLSPVRAIHQNYLYHWKCAGSTVNQRNSAITTLPIGWRYTDNQHQTVPVDKDMALSAPYHITLPSVVMGRH